MRAFCEEGAQSRTTDFLGLLDAAYRVEQPRESWFAGLLASAAFLDRGAGLGLILYDVSSGTEVRLDALDGFKLTADWKEAGASMHTDPRLVPGIIEGYQSVRCATFEELSAQLARVGSNAVRTARADYYDAHQFHDAVFINGLDCSGKGCSLQVFSRNPVSLSAAEREVYSLLAVHLTSAYRLQRRWGRPELENVDAVLRPDGRVEHIAAAKDDSATRRLLSEAVSLRRWARGHASTCAPATVMQAYAGLANATWTLVDCFDRDGKRFVVACRTFPGELDTAALSVRERQVAMLAKNGRSNKEISYDLGLAHSTVRVLLARVARKLGIRSRSELTTALECLPVSHDQ